MKELKVKKDWLKTVNLILIIFLALFMVSCVKANDGKEVIVNKESSETDNDEPETEEAIISEDVNISWIDTITFNGITYEFNGRYNPDELLDHSKDTQLKLSLGQEFSEVLFNVSENVFELDYRQKHGDATYLSKGTKVFEVEGYLPTYRLAISQDDMITIYEVSRNINGKTLGDLYDIKGRLSYITINSEVDGTTVLGKIESPDQINLLEKELLAAPIMDVDMLLETEEGMSEWRTDREGERYFLTFYLLDGTSFSKSYWIESGAFGSDAKLSAVYGEVVSKELH
jgi:hypothetical protein